MALERKNREGGPMGLAVGMLLGQAQSWGLTNGAEISRPALPPATPSLYTINLRSA